MALIPSLALLNIHRRYFTQALQDQPNDLLKHKYGPSVMAMYRSAWRMIESHSQAVRRIPKHIERLSLFWSHALSAAVSSLDLFPRLVRRLTRRYDEYRLSCACLSIARLNQV
jgi:hypothetical protein